MRSLLLLTALSSAALAGDRNLLIRVPEAPKKKKSLVEKVFSTIDGGDMHGFAHPDNTQRKAENPLGTLTVRWQFKF